MTEFPELQQALVHAAGRRRRAPRLARPLVVAVACAAIAAAALTITREPNNDERAAAPAPDPLAPYAVFQHAATRADEPPSAVTGMPGLTVEQARLAARSGPWRVYLTYGTLDGREVLCAFAVLDDRSRFGCDPPGTVHGYGFPTGDGDPGALVATVPDGIDEVEFGFRGRAPLHAPVRDNAVLAPLNSWPSGPGTISWDGGEAPLKAPPSAP